jgi:hypothetical protein
VLQLLHHSGHDLPQTNLHARPAALRALLQRRSGPQAVPDAAREEIGNFARGGEGQNSEEERGLGFAEREGYPEHWAQTTVRL